MFRRFFNCAQSRCCYSQCVMQYQSHATRGKNLANERSHWLGGILFRRKIKQRNEAVEMGGKLFTVLPSYLFAYFPYFLPRVSFASLTFVHSCFVTPRDSFINAPRYAAPDSCLRELSKKMCRMFYIVKEILVM